MVANGSNVSPDVKAPERVRVKGHSTHVTTTNNIGLCYIHKHLTWLVYDKKFYIII